MHPQHRILLGQIQKHQRKRDHGQANDSYLSSSHHYYDVSVPERRRISKDWVKANGSISDGVFVAVLESLFHGKSHEEKTLASILLAYHKTGRGKIGPKHLSGWLDHLVGWAEIDSLCAGVYPADEVLADWKAWQAFLRRLARDRNINKRRAALVFLTGPARTSGDPRIAALGFEVIDRLKSEREIIVTKAVSWLLRSLVQHHKKDVARYLASNRSTLPAIAVRETERKIRTGRK